MASINNLTAVYTDRLYLSSSTGVSEISDTYVTKTELTNSTQGAVSQTAFDNSITTLNSKDLAYNNTITSHISLLDTNTTNIASNTASISTLNTKNLDNFNAITAINTNLANNYQTNSQLTTNYYNKTDIDTNIYTKTEIDTNIYTKTEVDGLVGSGSGYTDTEIDNFLALKANLSLFIDNVSFFPVIDLSRPTILHQGLTLKNSVINVEPLAGALFSNQFGEEADRDVAIFKNKSNYITLKGNKIIANATSDDALTTLDLNPSDNVKIANLIVGDITVPDTGSDIIRNIGDANYTLRIRDTQAVWEFRNRNFRCMNPNNPANGTEMVIHDTGGDYRLRIGSQTNAQVGIGI